MRQLALFAAVAVVACGPSVKKVAVDPPSANLDQKGATALFKAIARDDKDRPVTEGVKVAWTSSAPLVASVDEAGKVTALTSGEATITAAVGEVKGAAKVFVSIPASVTVAPGSLQLKPGESGALEVRVADDSGRPLAAPGNAVWASSDPAVATVVGGRVLAVGGGKAVISASVGALKAEAPVTVKLPEFAKLAVKPGKLSLAKAGQSGKLAASALDKKGKPVAGVPVAWKSSAAAVVRVAPDGTVTAVKKGKAKITASAGGKSASAEV
ncbi:MAG TPA: Ig-like domain-containing protein, partial [Anaeromyxobacteraceae bacterium]|nr:Ig-like domain-containing protein [Anaeromyxobacteraceae bacterium]